MAAGRGKLGSEGIDREVGALASGRENDELGVGKAWTWGRSLAEEARDHRGLLWPQAPASRVATQGAHRTLLSSGGVFAFLEGAVGDALQKFCVVRQRSNVAPVDVFWGDLEVNRHSALA